MRRLKVISAYVIRKIYVKRGGAELLIDESNIGSPSPKIKKKVTPQILQSAIQSEDKLEKKKPPEITVYKPVVSLLSPSSLD